MDSGELETYRQHHARVTKASWMAALGVPVACGLTVALAWSPLAGLGLALVLESITFPLHMRWAKARWIKRFPELGGPGVAWRRR